MANKLSIGIVGLPNVGKSTLFKVLTSQDIVVANYPFATIDPNVGIVSVPDERLDTLTKLSNSKKTVPAVVEFYDIAGLVKGANKGEGLGNKFLSHIRDTQAIVIVLRVFKNDDIIHVENSVDPMRDMNIITGELMLKDLETIEKRLSSLEKEARSGDKKAAKNQEVLATVRDTILEGGLVHQYAEEEIVKELQLLSAKRQLYLLNGTPEEVPHELAEKILEMKADYLTCDLSEPNEAVRELIKKAYSVLNLISFFTTGDDETRAWTVRRGALAPEAAGVIHTDFESKFIRAEVVPYEKLVEAKGWSQAKQKGWMKLEGKEYEVKDGDVLVVRHG